MRFDWPDGTTEKALSSPYPETSAQTNISLLIMLLLFESRVIILLSAFSLPASHWAV